MAMQDKEIVNLSEQLLRYQRLRSQTKDPWLVAVFTALMEEAEALLTILKTGRDNRFLFPSLPAENP
jgi:hypothetical protein